MDGETMADDPFATLIDTDAIEWIETPGGNAFKALYYSDETGAWSALFRAKAGTVNPPHTHLGSADFYVISGSMEYRGGFARAGSWIYEPMGAVHEATSHPEDTLYLSNVRGPLAFHGPDGRVTHVSNGEAIRDAIRARMPTAANR
jgi:anti-sigma factor ChrR (cupin superfamily)